MKIFNNKYLRRSLPILAVIAAAFTSAKAQESSRPKIETGVQVSFTAPLSKKDYGPGNGFGAGAFLELVWSDRLGLRGQLEYMKFDKYKILQGYSPDNTATIDVEKSHGMVLVDGIYYPSIKYVPYVFLGFGVGTLNADHLDQSAEGSVHFGFGYKLNRQFGVEIKQILGSDARFQLSALFRF